MITIKPIELQNNVSHFRDIPSNEKIYDDYEQITNSICLSMLTDSKLGKDEFSMAFFNHTQDIEFSVRHNKPSLYYLRNYTNQQVLDFVEKIHVDFIKHGYNIKTTFSGGYGDGNIVRILKINWQQEYVDGGTFKNKSFSDKLYNIFWLVTDKKL